MTITLNGLTAIARVRGEHRGEADKEHGFFNDAPLSGEWAGESANELLGDLFRTAEVLAKDSDESYWLIQDICDAYESGYSEGWHKGIECTHDWVSAVWCDGLQQCKACGLTST
jgi:hypothetical protein